MDSLLNDSLTAENDDRLLVCQVCQLSFTSLQNKRSHFGGRLHRQALIKQLHHIISVNDDPVADTVTERHIQRSSSDTNKNVTEQLSHTGIQYTGVSFPSHIVILWVNNIIIMMNIGSKCGTVGGGKATSHYSD